MIFLKAPLQSGRDTEIDMIERQMEGGVVVMQPLRSTNITVENRLGGLVEVEEHVDVRKIRPKDRRAPKG